MTALGHHFRVARLLAGTAIRRTLIDRGMFFTDFVLATALPFATQWLIWQFVYGGRTGTEIAGFSYEQTLFYYAYAIAMGRLNNGWDIIQWFAEAIHDGSMEMHRLRPYPLFLQRLSDFMGGGLLYWIPLVVIALLQAARGGLADAGPWFWIGLAALFLSSQVLCFALAYTLALLAFWLIRSEFLLVLLSLLSALFGGLLLPPAFWPAWAQPLMAHNPFRYMLSAFGELMVRPDAELLRTSLLLTLAYALGFILIGVALSRGVRSTHENVGG